MLDFRSLFARWFDRDRAPTHTLMTGGKLHVPLEDVDVFHTTYAKFISFGGVAFVNTIKTPIFAMYFDIDAHFSKETSFDAVEWRTRFAVRLLEAMHELLHPTNFGVLVCASPPKSIVKDNKDCVKHGLHIHFPDVYVDRDMALWLREAILTRLENYDETRVHPDSPTTWADDLDEAVYNNGLRMIFSHKSKSEARSYEPVLHICADLSSTTQFGRSVDDLLRIVRLTEIRDRRSESVISHAKQNPSWLPNAVTLSRKRRRKGGGRQASESEDFEKSNMSTAQKTAVRDWMDIKIQKGQLSEIYRDAKISSGFLTDTNAFVRLNSKYCLNVEREHTSSTVYLQFSQKSATACMRCYCARDTTDGRQDGLCKLYKSAPIQANRLQKVLFPTET